MASVVFTMFACAQSPWTLGGAPKTPPDRQVRTGAEIGFDYWIWNCDQGKQVVIRQYSSACFGARDPQMVTGACGPSLLTKDEEERIGDAVDTVPPDLRWPGSPAERPANARVSPVPSGAPRATSPAP